MADNASNVASADLAALNKVEDSGPHIAETPVASAKYAPPSFATPGAARTVKLPIKITPTRIMLGVIIFLLIVIILMAGFTLYALTNGPVNVTVNAPNSTGEAAPPPNPIAVGEPNPATPEVQPTDVYVYVILRASDFPDSEVPSEDLRVGYIQLPGGSDYLIPYLTSAQYDGEDTVQKALNDLLAMKNERVTNTNYRTHLLGDDLTVDVLEDAAGNLKVNFKGTWPASGETINYAKEQVERTIQRYTFNYTVTLNGSEAAYRCIGSEEAACVQ